MTGIWEFLIAVGFVGLLVFGLYRAGRLRAPIAFFQHIWGMVLRTRQPPEPPPPAKAEPVPEVIELPPSRAALPAGNIELVENEYGVLPNLSEVVIFPERDEPVTPFESFNQRLFLLSTAGGMPNWPKVVANDFPTRLTGSLDWAAKEARRRLRPAYPVIIDTFGWWGWASSALEMNPDATNPIIDAYMRLPLDRRPVVISVLTPPDKAQQRLQFLRYGFRDYTLNSKFLEKHPASLLHQAMIWFTGTDDDWREMSPARLRKVVIDQHAMYDMVTRSLQRTLGTNQFAALWELPETPAKSDDAERAG